MTSVQEKSDTWSTWEIRAKYVAYFVSWVAYSALTFYLVTRISPLLRLLMDVLDVNRWAQSAVHNFSFFTLGLIGLCMVIIVENYLRTAIPQNLLLRRIVIALGAVLILTGVSHALPEFLFYLLRT
ncbi:MAG: hypothetical protein F4X14_21065 [Caldilineaceae bacterium SB0661_bin_32]|uniref:Uncharacterized protein n=1 Tax=Caldilineaceae bacterium SB0661_bin_32 TaxID=2605255 RepID=A0A6B1DDF3_9CHLR|nr:hypothetical protein [Caldilineaceae bacterium SB0661_bin_32]